MATKRTVQAERLSALTQTGHQQSVTAGAIRQRTNSKKMLLIIPVDVHTRLKMAAVENRRNLNDFTVELLQAGLK